VLLSFRFETQNARNDRLSDPVTSAVLFSNCFYNERGGNFDNISTEHRSLDSLLMNSPFRVIKSCLSMKVLDLMDSSTKANAPVATLDFNYGGNQLWFVEKAERGYLLHPWHSKMVIGINPEDNSVVQQEYNGKDNQIWIISGKINSARLLNYATQKYLTVDTNKIDLKSYLTSPSQLWNFLILGDIQKEINTCNCLQNFEYAKNLMETSYPGFNDKAQTKSQYDQLLRLSSEKAGATKNFYTCFKIINRYLSFFQDNHIQFWITYGYGYKNVRSNADIIQVGCNYITNTIAFLETEKQSHNLVGLGGLIGNKFFDNFSVVLDFKNNYLYLKSIENKRIKK
jgi:hypothetical protein